MGELVAGFMKGLAMRRTLQVSTHLLKHCCQQLRAESYLFKTFAGNCTSRVVV